MIGAIVSVGVGIVLLGKFLIPARKPKKTLFTVAKADIPVNGALVYRESRVAIVRDGGGIYALNLVCTHLGCTIAVTPRGLFCPCHGSVFDRHGVVVKGPAGRALERYTVEDRGHEVAVLL